MAKRVKGPEPEELGFQTKEMIAQAELVAAGHMEVDQSDMDKAIETSQEVEISSEAIHLHIMQNPPVGYASAVGLIRSNTASHLFAVVAASDHKLPSPRFGAFEVTFSDVMQTATCIPVERYDKNNRKHCKVTWSKEGDEWRCEMAPLLIQKGWMPTVKKALTIPITIRRHHPKVGTAIILWFRNAETVDSDYVKKKKAEEKAAAKAAAEAQAKAAKEAEGTTNAARAAAETAKASQTQAKTAKAAEVEEIEDEEFEDEEE